VHETGRVGGSKPAPGRDKLLDDRMLQAGLLEPLAQRAPVEQLLREEHGVPFGADLVDRDHVRVRHARHGLALAHHADAILFVARRVAHDLQRDLTIELRIVGGIDRAHSSTTELGHDGESADLGAALVHRCADTKPLVGYHGAHGYLQRWVFLW
jgi:hypothetical protein